MSTVDQASALLDQARDSLEDATLLASGRRRNAGLLREVALRQALSAISLEEGLDVSETLGLETLLRRVPAVHPQAALVRRLSDPGHRTVQAIGRLIAGLSAPAPGKQAAEPKTRPKARAKAGAKTRAKAGAEKPAGHEKADGANAFDASPHGQAPRESEAGVTSSAFWVLMDRWRIGDLDALALIGHQGGLTKKGTRPRFRLRGPEARLYASLRQIDGLLEALGLSADWLRTERKEPPFDGRNALALMTAEPGRGVGGTIQALNRQGLRSAVSGS